MSQDQSQDKTRLQDQSSSPSPDRTQDQDRIYEENVTRYFAQVQDRQQDLLRDPSLSTDQQNYDLALYSLSIAGNVTGSESPDLTRLYQEIAQTTPILDQAQRQIHDRDPLSRTLLQTTSQNQDRIREMEQLLQNCTTCDSQVRLQLEEQLQVLSQNQTRLRELALQEQNNKGWLGWLFR